MNIRPTQPIDDSAAAMPVYSDAYIEARADEFLALGLADQGISLLQFLAEPERYREQVGLYRPLLPSQRAVQRRLDALEAAAEADAMRACPSLECRGGALVEPLHPHHHHGRRGRRCDFRRRAGRGRN
jgi:hypothetical protein